MKKRRLRFIALLNIFMLLNFLMPTFGIKASASISDYYNRQIRVGLTSSGFQNIASLDFTLKGSYKLYSLAGNDLTGVLTDLNTTIGNDAYNVSVNSGYMSLLQGSTVIATVESGTSLKIIPVDYSNNLTSFTADNNSYMGSINFLNKTSYIRIVNTLFLENYLYGVVPAEMYESYPIEALKAQAVAARTYAFINLMYPVYADYDVDNTTNFQAYSGYDSATINSIKAVDDTRGIILTYNGQPFRTYFSASNGGFTEVPEHVWGGSLPAYQSTMDNFDTAFRYTRTFTVDEINNRLSTRKDAAGQKYIKDIIGNFVSINLATLTKYPSGRIHTLDLVGTTGTYTVTDNYAAFFLNVSGNGSEKNLLSSLYSINYDNNTKVYTFTGSGFGHGVGLSQIGAAKRADSAANGGGAQSYTQILNFYYPNSAIQRLYNIPQINSFTPGTAALKLGDSIEFNTAATGGTDLLYKYMIYNYWADTWSTLSDYSSNSKFNWTPKEIGHYKVTCFVKDSISTRSYDTYANSDLNITNPIIIQGITPSSTSVDAGENVQFTTSVEGGFSPEYKYMYYDYSKDLWTPLTSYTDNPSFLWTPISKGRYQVVCFVRDKGTSTINSYDTLIRSEVTVNGPTPIVIQSVSSNNSNSEVGANIQFTASISGGYVPEYKYAVYNYAADTWAALNTYNSSSSVNWKPVSKGNYQVVCFVREKGSVNAYDDIKRSEITIKAPAALVIQNITPGNTIVAARTNVLFTTQVYGGINPEFKYAVYNYATDEWTAITSYNNNPSVNWTTVSKGKYQIVCFVRQGGSASTYDLLARSEVTVTDSNSIVINSITPNNTAFAVNSNIQFTTKVSGGSMPEYKYALYNYSHDTWTNLNTYNSSSSINWTPLSKGKYQVVCFVRDKGSLNSYDSLIRSEMTVN